MLLFTIVYDGEKEDVVESVRHMVDCFKEKKIDIGISESLDDNIHFIKIYCNDINCSEKFINSFNINMANVLYNVAVNEFFKEYITDFLCETYFFLKYDELNEVKDVCLKALRTDSPIVDENSIYYMNRKNSVIEKIVECIKENKEINIKGFITFRMNEIKDEFENIVDRVVEKYMVDKEYNEFIKLLKYFVDIAESKIDEVHIVIDKEGNYNVFNKYGEDIMNSFLNEINNTQASGIINMDDMIISGLITNAPNKIVIHGVEDCINKELIDTIKKVFSERVEFRDNFKFHIQKDD